MDKSWKEVEREETETLFRKKLEELNEIHPDHLDCGDIEMIYRIHKTMWIICQNRKLEHEMMAMMAEKPA